MYEIYFSLLPPKAPLVVHFSAHSSPLCFCVVFVCDFCAFDRTWSMKRKGIIMAPIKNTCAEKGFAILRGRRILWGSFWITLASTSKLPKSYGKFRRSKKPQIPIKRSSSCFTSRDRLLIKHKFRNNKSSFNGRICSILYLAPSTRPSPTEAILEHLSFKLHFYLIFVCIYTI
jgi:hypothetical protein